MKKLTLIVATMLALGISTGSFAQQTQQTVPHAFKYQAVARNANGEAIASQNVSFRISIVQGSVNGTAVYQETQLALTNQFGLANLSIGRGNIVSGSIDDIQWGNGSYFVRIEFDPKGGSDYALMGTSEMLSVPYALYAENTGNIQGFPVKVALQGTNIATPLNNPETGMLVYNTGSAGLVPNNVVPGYYYNAGSSTAPNWVSLSSEDKAGLTGRILTVATNSNTTYGGISQDGTTGGTIGNATSNPSGADNTAFGFDAFGANGSTNPSNNYNSAFGYEAMFSITTGEENTAVGTNALYSTQGGSNNTAVGLNAMYTNVSGTDNTGIGFGALYNTTAGGNTATGYDAGNTNGTGQYNTADGLEALFSNNSGSYNTATGELALYSNSSASGNTADGHVALEKNQTGFLNSAVGDSALYNNTSDSNTAVGYGALITNTGGSDNTAIGFGANVGSNSLRNATAIGGEAKVNTSNSVVIGGTGFDAVFVGIGTASPVAGLHLKDGGGLSNCHFKSDGSKPTTSATTGYTCSLTNATDLAGTVSITPNGTGAGSGTVSFNKSYNLAPTVVITPSDSAAAANISLVYVTSSTGSFIVNFNGIPTHLIHSYFYHVIETVSN